MCFFGVLKFELEKKELKAEFDRALDRGLNNYQYYLGGSLL